MSKCTDFCQIAVKPQNTQKLRIRTLQSTQRSLSAPVTGAHSYHYLCDFHCNHFAHLLAKKLCFGYSPVLVTVVVDRILDIPLVNYIPAAETDALIFLHVRVYNKGLITQYCKQSVACH